MRKNIVLVLLSVLLFAITTQTNARPYNGQQYNLRQPDGSLVAVLVWGDEFYQDVEGIDGYTLLRDTEGWICYARVSDDSSRYQSTGVHYPASQLPSGLQPHLRISSVAIRRAAVKSQRVWGNAMQNSSQLTKRGKLLPDTVYGLTLLINFPDVTSSIPKSDFEEYCNGDNFTKYGNSESIKKYFQWVSNNKLTYINYVAGYYTADSVKSYYDNPDVYGGPRLYTIITKALNQLKASGFDFSKLTLDANNNIKAVNIFYAGTPESGWAKGLWPHSGWFGGTFSANGITVGPYQITDIGNELSMSTFCHENGHMVCGWPDFYSYDGHSDNNEDYCFGCGSDKSPGMPSPWQRDKHGWIDLTDITNLSGGAQVTLEAFKPRCAVYYGTNSNAPNERYYIELRKTGGRFVEPKEGVLIWHNNLDGDNTTAGRPEFQELRPATVADPCFKKGVATVFNDLTNPSGNWANGQASSIDLWDVTALGTSMSFRMGSPRPFITSVALPAAINGIAYSSQLKSSGGQAPYTYSVISGGLPQGITLAANGVVSGISTNLGNFGVLVRVTDANGQINDQEVTLAVGNNGLNYSYYQTASLSKLPNFASLTAKKTGVVSDVLLDNAMREDYWAMLFTGYIKIDAEADYTFFTSSDDGSKLLIDGTAVVLNDGLHGTEEQSGSIHLTTGYHTFRLEFFECTGGQTLLVQYQSANIAKQKVPSSILFFKIPPFYIETYNLPLGYSTVAYTQSVKVQNGSQPYTFSLTSGSLPMGLSLSANGVVSGTTALSGTFQFTITVTDGSGTSLQKQMQLKVTDRGVAYNYYNLNSSNKTLPNFATLTAAQMGVKSNFTLDGALQSDYYAFDYTGYIEIYKEADYSFFINSDDGSKLFINNTQLINNDGLHSPQERSGKVHLTPGRHKIEVQFLEYSYSETLEVQYESTGYITKAFVPDSILFLTPAAMQYIALVKGWNLISTNLRSSDSTIATLFKNLDVQEIKDLNSFWRKGQLDEFNGLQKITVGEGYLVNMNVAGTLTVTGMPIVETGHALSLQTNGWQMIGCPYQAATPFSHDFNATNCSVIKDFTGFWIPNGTANSIQNFEVGKGYFIKK